LYLSSVFIRRDLPHIRIDYGYPISEGMA